MATGILVHPILSFTTVCQPPSRRCPYIALKCASTIMAASLVPILLCSMCARKHFRVYIPVDWNWMHIGLGCLRWGESTSISHPPRLGEGPANMLGYWRAVYAACIWGFGWAGVMVSLLHPLSFPFPLPGDHVTFPCLHLFFVLLVMSVS